MTQYKPIADFPRYRVGSDGTVQAWLAGRKGDKRNPGRWKTKKAQLKRGVMVVQLHNERGCRQFTIARLVLSAFVGPRPMGCRAIHFPDPDIANNRAENLRWAPANANHSPTVFANARPFPRGESHPNSVLTVEDVRRIRSLVAKGFSPPEIAERFGVEKTAIRSIMKGRTWKHVP